MRRIITLFAVALSVFVTTVTPVRAITGNYVEDFEHPFVGLVTFFDAEGEYLWRCSGSLLTPTVFLTAGHCADTGDGAASAIVYFQQDAGEDYDPALGYDPTTGYPLFCAGDTLGTLCATSDELYNYGFDSFAGFPNTRDVGLVILDQPIALAEYGVLANPGSLDKLATRRGQQETTFTASGYGLSLSNPVKFESYRERLMATGKLTNLRSALNDGFNLQTNGNGKGNGGTCSGDSGGPVFYGGYESNIIVAVTSFGLNAYCRGADFAYRTDQQAVIDWIRATVGEAEFDKVLFTSI